MIESNTTKWYYYDDMGDANLEEFLNDKISISNIRGNHALVLFKYKE